MAHEDAPKWGVHQVRYPAQKGTERRQDHGDQAKDAQEAESMNEICDNCGKEIYKCTTKRCGIYHHKHAKDNEACNNAVLRVKA